MNEQTRRDYWHLIVGMFLGLLVAAMGMLLKTPTQVTHAELQREFEGYRMCMQAAGTNRCSMQPLDFVRYVEIKHLLSIPTEIIQREK